MICFTFINAYHDSCVDLRTKHFIADAYESITFLDTGGLGDRAHIYSICERNVGFWMSLDNPLLGVGPGNYKLFTWIMCLNGLRF